jgi:hypothetical protein
MEIYLMKRIALFLLMGLAVAQANAAQLTITFDVNITDLNGDAIDINTNYSSTMDTNDFYIESGEEYSWKGISHGMWTYGSLTNDIENIKNGVTTNPAYSDAVAVQAYDQDLYDNALGFGQETDGRLFNSETQEVKEASESLELQILTPGLNPVINNVNDFIMLLLSTKDQSISGDFTHNIFAATYADCVESAISLGAYDCDTLTEESFYSYMGTTKISSIKLDGVEVSAVPVPAAAWLMGSGLLGLTAVARRKKV